MSQSHQTGSKHDTGKPAWHLMPWAALARVQAVLDYGAKKYGEFNWVAVSSPRRRYLSAAFRHLIAYAKGDYLDEESGQPHLAHAICCLLFLIHFEEDTSERCIEQVSQGRIAGLYKDATQGCVGQTGDGQSRGGSLESSQCTRYSCDCTR